MLFMALVRNKKLLIPLTVLIVLAVVFAPPYISGRIFSIFDPHHPENTSRLMLWGAGLQIFADHPLLGVGDIDLHELFVEYLRPQGEFVWGHLHNVPMQFLVTLGAVGFVVVMALFVRILAAEWSVYKRVKDEWFSGSVALGALAVFVGFMVNGLTEWSFGDQEVVIVFWTTVGLTLAVGNLNESRRLQTT
jgi:O-antigen ligase